MKWAKFVTTVAILGTWVAIACSSDNKDESTGTGGAGGNDASASGGSATAGKAGGGKGGKGGATATGGDAGAATAGTPGAAGASGAAGAGSLPDPECRGFSVMCENDSECCSGSCDLNTNTCASAIGQCKAAGEVCAGATDCCTFHCVNALCSDMACISDNQACTEDTECCGGKCVTGACEPLNPNCSTAGNDCTSNTECCSELCGADGKCTLGASFCIQPGDACVRNQDCCSGECNIGTTDLVGTCNIPPSGSTFCSGVDGVICHDCGDCCSRLCAPYLDTGVTICQPVSGCHSTGDLCRTDEDCCGGRIDPELPGYSNGACQIEPDHSVGICRNPVNGAENPDGACSPQGNVCHYKDYSCNISSSRANCCGGLGAKGGVCQLDLLGVPRCNGLGDTCRCGAGTSPDGSGGCVSDPTSPGETCASSDDCCGDLPCVPDAQGVLRCGDVACVMQDGGCTIDGDCCPGLTCIRPPGSTSGTCDGPMMGTGGAPPVACAVYGQICTDASDCCNAVPCTDNICKYPPQ